MGLIVIFLLILLPVAEIATLIAVGDEIGFFPTLALLIGAGLLGTFVLRIQGAEMMLRLRETVARREPPTAVLFDGVCLAMAGLLLVLPGLISDAVAILLLLPPVRAGLRALVLRGRPGSATTPGAARDGVIEGDFVVVVEPKPKGEPPAGHIPPPGDGRP